MSFLLEDVRYACRLVLRNPLFSSIVVLTLALGIGANTAIFSVVNAVLLTPLPYRAPERLVAIFSQFPTLGFDRFFVSPPEFLEYRRMTRSFASLGAYTFAPFNLVSGTEPMRVTGASVSADFLTTLGVEPQLGRRFNAAEDRPHGDPVVLLGDGLWQRAFGADKAVVGRRVTVDGAPRTVIGVMPRGFDIGGQKVELWVPLALGPLNLQESELHSLFMVGRLRPAVTLDQARAELAGIVSRWPGELPSVHTPKPKVHPLVIRPLLDDLVGDTRPKMRLLAAAVGLVLLVACANVAGLLLARAETRQREIALRSALGAGRGALLRQFLTESVTLSLLGGGLGLVLAHWGLRAILAANPEAVPRLQEVGIDGRVLLFTLAVSAASGLLFGIAPLLYARSGLAEQLKAGGGRQATAGAARQRLRRALVVAELGLATALVIAGGLVLRSFVAMQRVDLGFAPRGLLSLRLDLSEGAYPESRQVAAFYRDLTEGLAGLPGVEAVAAMTGLPPLRGADANATIFESVPEDPAGPPHSVDYWQYVTPDYFRTLGIPLIAGRRFNAGDSREAPAVVIINQTMAKVFWPGKDPLGQRLRATDHTAWMTIVGIVGDVKQGGVQEKTGTEMYLLEPQAEATVGGVPRTLYVVARGSGDPQGLATALRTAIRQKDPSLPIEEMLPMTEVVDRSIDQPRFMALLVGTFAVVALLLAAIGVYGLISHTVARRNREIGVRLALGESVRAVMGSVIRQGLALAGIGIMLGVLVAIAARKLLSGLLFGVTAGDPWVMAGVALLLALVSVIASYVPARRATRVDPAVTLRME